MMAKESKKDKLMKELFGVIYSSLFVTNGSLIILRKRGGQ